MFLNPRPSPFRQHRGFSLIELLTVIAIVVLISALLAPAVTNIGRGFTTTTTGQTVLDHIVNARQLALSKNRNAEVRFYKSASEIDGESLFRGVQVWVQEQKDGMVSYQPATRVSWMKDGFKILESEKFSPLIGSEFSGYRGTADLPTNPATEYYQAVRFRATGTPEATLAPENNFITIAGVRETGADIPENYYTIQIDPLTGRATVYRP